MVHNSITSLAAEICMAPRARGETTTLTFWCFSNPRIWHELSAHAAISPQEEVMKRRRAKPCCVLPAPFRLRLFAQEHAEPASTKVTESPRKRLSLDAKPRALAASGHASAYRFLGNRRERHDPHTMDDDCEEHVEATWRRGSGPICHETAPGRTTNPISQGLGSCYEKAVSRGYRRQRSREVARM